MTTAGLPPDTAKPVPRKRPLWERILVWGGILLLVALVLNEWKCRQGYDATLAALENRLVGQPGLPLSELSSHAHGFFIRGERVRGERRWVTLQWPSPFKSYKLRLQIQKPDTICLVEADTVEENDASLPSKPTSPSRVIPPRIVKPKGLPAGYEDKIALTTTAPIGGPLAREIVRQALLLAAEEELGITTIDPAIGEVIPMVESPKSFPFTILRRASTAPPPPRAVGEREIYVFSIELVRPNADGTTFTWLGPEMKIPPGGELEYIASRMHEISPSLAEVWQKAGYKKADVSTPAAHTPVELEDRMDVVSQFAIVRELHSQIKATGETPELLGGLIRAYANLGSLTDFYWRTFSKSFKARALLFVERLIAKTGETPFSLSHRAYALALIGRHATASQAVKAARSAQGQPVPEWLDLIDHYCEFRPDELDRTKTKLPELANYLQMRMADPDDLGHEKTLEIIERFHESNPASTRVAESMAEISSLGIQTSLPPTYAAIWPEVYRRLLAIPDLPPSAKVIALEGVGSDNKRTSEFAIRERLIEALSAEVQSEVGIPSWSLLADLLRDDSFVQAYRVVKVERTCLGIDPRLTVMLSKPLYRSHPLGKYFEVYEGDGQKAHQAITKVLEELDPTLYDHPVLAIATEIGRNSGLPRELTSKLGNSAGDPTWEDLLSTRVSSIDPDYLLGISPKRPRVIAAMIRDNPVPFEKHAVTWEAEYADHPIVMTALANKYISLDKNADAKRCLNRLLTINPSLNAYKLLAKIHSKEGNREEWEKALIAALQMPSYGLEHADIQSDLAKAFMARGEWKKAEPYAMAAADTGAAWAMLIAARCAEGLQDWDLAEKLTQATSRRYREEEPGWLFWCLRTGRGNLAAATALAERHFKSLQSPTPGQWLKLGLWHFAKGEVSQARGYFEKLMNDGSRQFSVGPYAVYSAILADAENKTDVRDEIVNRFSDRYGSDDCFADFANLIAGVASGQEAGRWSTNEFDRLISIGPPDQIPSMYFFASMFLRAHGQEALADEYRQCAATAYNVQLPGCMLANLEMRRQGIDIGPTRLNDVANSLVGKAEPLRLARQAAAKEDCRTAEIILDKLLEKSPDFMPALICRAQVRKDVDNFTGAIADYEKVLTLDPNCYLAVDGLAWLLATCKVDELRDGTRAMTLAKHAASLRFYPWRTALTTLAAAHAELGEYEVALQLDQKTLSLTSYNQILDNQSSSYHQRKRHRNNSRLSNAGREAYKARIAKPADEPPGAESK